jgi:hypothetical protein
MLLLPRQHAQMSLPTRHWGMGLGLQSRHSRDPDILLLKHVSSNPSKTTATHLVVGSNYEKLVRLIGCPYQHPLHCNKGVFVLRTRQDIITTCHLTIV